METEEMAELRQRAQDAQSRARLATDKKSRKMWQELADALTAQLLELERARPPRH